MTFYSITGATQTLAIRGMNEAKQVVNDSMKKLSTGNRINSGADNPADLAKISRLTAQIQSTNQAVRNVNEALSDLEIADVALEEISDMLARMGEITVEASSEALSTIDRTTLTDEFGLLKQEVESLARNTKSNGSQLLDGSYSGRTYQVGPSSASTITASISEATPTSLGSYSSTGPTRDALAAAQTATANTTTGSEDIVLTANGNTTTIDVGANDSAKTVAGKINALSTETGISAEASTFAYLFSTNASSANYTIKINDTSTSSFAISSSDATDAVSKINLISATTGVSASATSDGKVLLHDADGDDITIENANSGTDLDVQALQNDGTTTQGSAISLAAGASTNNDATRVIGTLKLDSSLGFSISQSGNSSLGYTTSGTPSLSSLNSVDLSSATKAANSNAILSGASEQIATIRGNLGATESRLDYAGSFLEEFKSSLSQAQGKIRDTDFAVESARLAKAMVLQKTSTALLSQANASQSLVLNLLKEAS
jgi:flagellin